LTSRPLGTWAPEDIPKAIAAYRGSGPSSRETSGCKPVRWLRQEGTESFYDSKWHSPEPNGVLECWSIGEMVKFSHPPLHPSTTPPLHPRHPIRHRLSTGRPFQACPAGGKGVRNKHE
jgi:hypothetical protein